MPNYNAIEGNDVAGHVASVGEGVTEYAVGDKVRLSCTAFAVGVV